MMHEFHGSHVFVNGGNTGIGRAIVLGFARAGAAVTFVYHGGPEAHAAAGDTVREAEAAGARVAAAGSIIDRSGGRANVAVPRTALAVVAATAWSPETCPLCQQGVPVIKPGSRPQ